MKASFPVLDHDVTLSAALLLVSRVTLAPVAAFIV